MDDNMMNLIGQLIDAETDNARLNARLDVLHKIVDREEYEATKRQIDRGEQEKKPAYTTISVSEIRDVMGWSESCQLIKLICSPKKKEES